LDSDEDYVIKSLEEPHLPKYTNATMSEVVSVAKFGICYLAGYAALNGYARGGSAISFEAKAAQKEASTLVQSAERSQALFGAKAAVISQLRALANECADGNWDGNGAHPVNPVAVFMAESFVRAIPSTLPLPELAPEPDGSVSLDWIQSRNRLFSLSVGPNNRLAYAWLDGTDKGHGVASFDRERIPQRVLEGINAIVNSQHAAVGSC